jgi:Uma2 family endonuclease
MIQGTAGTRPDAGATLPASPMRHRFSVDDFERMGREGILGENDRVELIHGEIIDMNPIGGPHMGAVNRLARLLSRLVYELAVVSVQNPVRLPPDGQPQPDITLIRPTAILDTVPVPADILLVIEVSDTSLPYDREVKLPLYAAAMIPEAWLVDLVNETIERHTEPRNGMYRQITMAARGESLASTVLPEMVLAVDDVLGRR